MGLTTYELRLFLVFGGLGGEECTYTDKQNRTTFLCAVKNLVNHGLLDVNDVNGAVQFRNTIKGIRLHEALMEKLTQETEL